MDCKGHVNWVVTYCCYGYCKFPYGLHEQEDLHTTYEKPKRKSSKTKRAAVKCYKGWLSTSLCAHPLELQSMTPTMKVVTYKDNARNIDFFSKEKLDNSRKIRLEKWLKEIGVTTTLNLTNGKVAVPLEVLEKLRSQLSSKF